MIIDVWSDVVCPWCFIGRRRLEKAIAALDSSAEISVRHRAFQLNPTANEVVNTKQYLSEKYRIDQEQVEQMQAQVCAIADGEGLCYNLDETQSGNTKNAHRLLLWADQFNKQDELLEVMYSTYFEKSGSLFDHESLLLLVEQVGLSSQEAKQVLNSNIYENQVDQDQQIAAQLGANGVPFFVIDMKYAISGAQPQEVFTETLAKALAER